MGWFVLAKFFSLLISLVHLGRLSDSEKDFEILLLRQQISILLRTHDQPVSATRFEKMTLAIIAASLRRVLKTYGDYFNRQRPHQGIRQESPIPRTPQNSSSGNQGLSFYILRAKVAGTSNKN
jgi:hypothetical protein